MPLSAYEKKRNKNVQKNEVVLQSFGLPTLAKNVNSLFSTSINKSVVPNEEESEAEYDPGRDSANESEEDDTDLEEEELVQVKVLTLLYNRIGSLSHAL